MGMKKSFIEIAQEINGREPVLSKICITANVQENMILHYKSFYFGKTSTMCRNFKFLSAEKIRFFLKKNQTFSLSAQ
jgi:hypothetical protein